jgi:hypothetical protein
MVQKFNQAFVNPTPPPPPLQTISFYELTLFLPANASHFRNAQLSTPHIKIIITATQLVI